MQNKFLTSLILTLLFLAACTQATAPPENSEPTQETLQGAVDITFPMSGAIIYSETIILQGTATNIPDDGFQIQLVTPDENVIAEATVQPEDDSSWFVEIVHGFTDDPTEVTIVAKNTDPNSVLDYDIELIALSNLENRPDGVFGSILSPTEGMQVGGDMILVSGRGSGFFEGTFILRLENAEGEVVTEMPVTMQNPNFIDDMLWEAELARNDFIGNGTLYMLEEDIADENGGEPFIIDSINVVVTSVAG